MKRASLTVALTLAAAAIATADVRVITHPRIPGPDVLDRLGLGLAWQTKIPLDGPLDGIHSVQVLPRGVGDRMSAEVIVQTLAGMVYLFDADTGTMRWNTPVGIPYSQMYAAAANDHSIVVTRREFFYVLHRTTGIQRVYKKNGGGERSYGVRLDSLPVAAPTLDREVLAFVYPDLLQTFVLPDFEAIATAVEKSPAILAMEREGSLQPLPLWNHFDPTLKIAHAPVLAHSRVGLAGSNGLLLSLVKDEHKIVFARRVAGPTTALGSHAGVAYLGSQDYYLYAFDVENEKMLWRFPCGASVVGRPEVTDVDVFAVVEGRGLYRIDRYLGQEYWSQPDAVRFVAAHYFRNPRGGPLLNRNGQVMARYVYAADRFGHLLILDGERGTVLAKFDTGAWNVPASNEWTDRVVFASRDGRVMALRPRDSRSPQRTKTVLPPPVRAKRDVAAPEAAPEMKKEEEKKADDKSARLAPPALPAFVQGPALSRIDAIVSRRVAQLTAGS